MKNSTAATQPATTLHFRTYAIRTVSLDGVLWFYLPDVCAALRRSPEVAKVVDDLRFPQFARRPHQDATEGEVVCVSPIGVWYLTELIDRMGGQAFAAWTRRQQRDLFPEPAPNDPNVFLTMLPDNCLPPRPARYSGRLNEWQTLRFSPAGMKEIGRWPALFAPVLDAFRAAEAEVLARAGMAPVSPSATAEAEVSR